MWEHGVGGVGNKQYVVMVGAFNGKRDGTVDVHTDEQDHKE